MSTDVYLDFDRDLPTSCVRRIGHLGMVGGGGPGLDLLGSLYTLQIASGGRVEPWLPRAVYLVGQLYDRSIDEWEPPTADESRRGIPTDVWEDRPTAGELEEVLKEHQGCSWEVRVD